MKTGLKVRYSVADQVGR